MKDFLRKIVYRFLRIFVPRRWIVDDYWIRIPALRKFALKVSLYNADVIGIDSYDEKIAAINTFLQTKIRGTVKDLYFTQEEKKEIVKKSRVDLVNPFANTEISKSKRSAWKKSHKRIMKKIKDYYRKFLQDFIGPNKNFQQKLRHYLVSLNADTEERFFSLEELIDLDKRILRAARKKEKDVRKLIFTKDAVRNFTAFFLDDEPKNAYPEGYIRHFFPEFKPVEFIANKLTVQLGKRKLFSPNEVFGVTKYISDIIRLRNQRNMMHRTIPHIKRYAWIAVVLLYLIPLLFDIALLAYGTLKNKYIHSSIDKHNEISSVNSPYARRSNKIFKMNYNFNEKNFILDGDVPPSSNTFKIDNNAEVAVELNYATYRLSRIQDQNGLIVLSVDKKKLDDLKLKAPENYEKIVKDIIENTWWRRILRKIDDITGGFTNLCNYKEVPLEEIHRGLELKLLEKPSPLKWIDKLNKKGDFLKVLYHKPNTKKWAELDEVPNLLIEAIILREDRRFRNDIFPIPHRGNDNLVIVQQIAKKIYLDIIKGIHDFSVAYKFIWLKEKSDVWLKDYDADYGEDKRGGSSISNQVVEMLFTKYIPVLSGLKSFKDGQIEQKKHELPASSALDWFWTEDEILEAYVNEVFGGHLYSHVFGVKSQAEMYFSRSLKDLNLRELSLIVAAVKKPSRIKEYAMWLKANELKDNLEGPSKTGNHFNLRKWEDDHLEYKVDRSNYRDIINKKKNAAVWLENRIDNILSLLYEAGKIDPAQYNDALKNQKINFDFPPGVITVDARLSNNIQRELNNELGQGRGDSGIVLITTIDAGMQENLQEVIDRRSGAVFVDPEHREPGQPAVVSMDGGARIIKAREKDDNGGRVVNRILADVGGSSRIKNEWDWVTQANRSLGSSLKPILILYFLLDGYNLSDMIHDSRIIYNGYTLEQQMMYIDFILRHPDKYKEIEEIEKNWFWIPKNYRSYFERWVDVKYAMAQSLNSVHAQIQEIVTPEAFAELLNQMMNITDERDMHKPYRSIILGGSSGDQRYEKYLQAFSIFPNGIIKKQTYIDSLILPDGTVIEPDYQPVEVKALDKFGKDYVDAALLLVNLALRETVLRGSMLSLGGIGSGKTGSSNSLKDALATVHFVYDGEVYIVGTRLGNRHNYSIGKAAHEVAVPMVRRIIQKTFDKNKILMGDEYDALLKKELDTNPKIVKVDNNYYLKGSPLENRKLRLSQILNKRRKQLLERADENYKAERYKEAAEYYEKYLKTALWLDAKDRIFKNMVDCYTRLENHKRVKELEDHFPGPGDIQKFKQGLAMMQDLKYRNYHAEREEEEKNDDQPHDKNGRKDHLIEYADRFVKKWNEKNGVPEGDKNQVTDKKDKEHEKKSPPGPADKKKEDKKDLPIEKKGKPVNPGKTEGIPGNEIKKPEIKNDSNPKKKVVITE